MDPVQAAALTVELLKPEPGTVVFVRVPVGASTTSKRKTQVLVSMALSKLGRLDDCAVVVLEGFPPRPPSWTCYACGEPATCVGFFEGKPRGRTVPVFGCDDHCAHDDDDHCVAVQTDEARVGVLKACDPETYNAVRRETGEGAPA